MDVNSANLFFFSGTGNSLRVAAWLAESCSRRVPAVRVASVGQDRPPKEFTPGSGELLGLVTATHAFTAPWLMIKFTARLPRGKGSPAVVVVTRGGAKIGRVFTPGLEGTACWLLALLLLLKGYDVRGVMPVDMPVNWLAVHPPIGKLSAEAIGARAKTLVQPFIEDVLSGRRRLHGFIGLLFGLVLMPISILYLFIGRFNLAKLFYASAACTGCGLCAESCPARAVKMRGDKKPRPYWTFACESCMRCMNICPEKAVEVSHPLAMVLVFVTAFPASFCTLNWLGAHCTMSLRSDNLWLRIPLQYVYILTSLWVTYLVFHLLMRVSLVNSAVTMLTLTRYWGRYREPRTDVKELTGRS